MSKIDVTLFPLHLKYLVEKLAVSVYNICYNCVVRVVLYLISILFLHITVHTLLCNTKSFEKNLLQL